MIEMGVEAKLMQQILSGNKTVEPRLRTGKFITLRKGDKISLRQDVWQNDRIVESTPAQATVKVTATDFFDNFADMLQVMDAAAILPSATSTKQVLQAYRQFYTPQQEAEHGVVAISFTVV